MLPRRLFEPIVMLAALASPRAAVADGMCPSVEPHDPVAAEVLFRQGRAQMEAGRPVMACPLFAESLRLDPTPGALLNLATCEESVGKLAQAWEHYTELAERTTESDERHGIAREHEAALSRRLPRLTVVVSGARAGGVRVARDGVELRGASLGVALPVDPGAHEVVVTAAAREAHLYPLNLAPGERRTLVVEPGAPQRTPPHRDRTVGYAIGGAGILVVAGGAVIGVRALQLRAASDADCSGSVCRDAAGAQAYADARTFTVASDVALGLGAVALAAGAYFAWLAPSGPPSTGLRITPTGFGATF